jgi:hypothetical protein
MGLITAPTIICRVCRCPMRVTAVAVMNNWGFNFMAPAWLAIWAAAVAIIFLNPEMAADWMREFRIPPTTALRDKLALVLLAGGLALFCSVPFLVVGRVIGFFVAQRLLSEPPPEVPMSNREQQQWTRQLPTPAGREPARACGLAVQPAPAQPAGRTNAGGPRFIARAFFSMLWASVFFVVGALVTAGVATAGIADPHLRNQASRHAGQASGIWLFLGSIGLAILLVSLGILPGTRRKARRV